jgi:MFS family permease
MGQSISLLGTWMQKTAVSWVIYSITQSKLMLGVSVFATLFPTALISLYGGIIADRYDRYKILWTTQVLSLIQAVMLTLAIIYFKEYAVWVIIVLSMLLGLINGFDVPARQSLMRDLIVDKNMLPNALALNSSMVNLSKLIGPAIAGFILEQYSDEVCFGANAVSFVPVILSLLLMKLPKMTIATRKEKNLRREFAEAFTYIRQTPVVSSIIVFVGIMSLLVLPFTTLTPVFAKDIFGGTASTLGIIDGTIGFGAFISALFLASLRQGTNLNRILAVNTGICAFGMMPIRTISNTIVQLHVPNHFRGRVISIYFMVMTTMMPIGSLIVSAISHVIGVRKTVFLEGIIALIVAVVYGRYVKRERLKREQRIFLGGAAEGELMQP